MKNRVLIVLGSPNSPDGSLSAIAISRLNLCFELFTDNDLILCTGGWGKQFNQSEKPHAYFAKQFLQNKGIPEARFLDFALSGNTVEDALMAKEILAKNKPQRVNVITSDYHVERTELIFKEVLSDYNISIQGAKCSLSIEEMQQLVQHESKRVREILQHGLYY